MVLTPWNQRIILFLVVLCVKEFISFRLLSSVRPSVHLLMVQRSFDGKDVYEGSIIEYISVKGSKRLAYVTKRQGAHLDVLNELNKSFSIPLHRVATQINGKFEYRDLMKLITSLDSMKQEQVQMVWKSLDDLGLSFCNLFYICEHVYGSIDPMKLFMANKLMQIYGGLYFKVKPSNTSPPVIPGYQPTSSIRKPSGKVYGRSYQNRYTDNNDRRPYSLGDRNEWQFSSYHVLSKEIVEENLKVRAVLHDFKRLYQQVSLGGPAISSSQAFNTQHFNTSGNNGVYDSKDGKKSPDTQSIQSDSSLNILRSYGEGLKQYIIKSHPWMMNGWAKKKFNETLSSHGAEFLTFLDLAPTVKNAKKILEIMGIWNQHTNIEKYIMDVSDEFPSDALEEAQYLLDNSDLIPDPDERLRRDLTSLDNEGAMEIDDAVSVETLETGQQKIWIHIADVSRWIRPGGPLSQEAERRMTSIYFPDEKISMFPEKLSTELLSLGAKKTSYAVSCGVTLDERGRVTSYEVCPSKVKITKRLSYNQLDEYLSRANEMGLRIESPISADIDQDSLPEESSTKQCPLVDIEPPLSNEEFNLISDISKLAYWARIRHSYRVRHGALDKYLRDKTDLSLFVRRVPDALSNKGSSAYRTNFVNGPARYTVIGHLYWNNATSNSIVTEYMVLMCQTIGKLCHAMQVPVWYKTQTVNPPLSREDLDLQPHETPYLRTHRILRHLRAANDSRVPGYHATTGSDAYVQCTSPIRRYHDLYNQYRLKSAMHGASLSEEWSHRASEEAGISRLDSMRGAEERLQTLNNIKLVSRNREQYWLQQYLEKLSGISPRPVLDCIVTGFHSTVYDYSPFRLKDSNDSDRSVDEYESNYQDSNEDGLGSMYDGIVLQLGSHGRHHLYHPHSNLTAGTIVKCHLIKCYVNPMIYLLIPHEFFRSNSFPTNSIGTSSNTTSISPNMYQINSGIKSEFSDSLPPALLKLLKPQNSSSAASVWM